MQRSDALLNVEMHHHGGVMPVGAARGLGVPAGLDQTHERLTGARQRGPLICGAVAVVVIAIVVIVFPLGDQRIMMGLQRRVERRRVQMRKFDPVAGALLVGGLGDRPGWLGPRFGFGARFQLDRGAQLADRRATGQLRIMGIGSVGGLRRDDADLIQRQPTFPHTRRAAGKVLEPVRDGGDRGGVGR